MTSDYASDDAIVKWLHDRADAIEGGGRDDM